MRELRRDPIVDRWVIISADRAARPMPAYIEPASADHSFCPFCDGAESLTPPETLALGREGSRRDGPGWRLRVVPNKFPALTREGELLSSGDDLYSRMSGVGAHEVIIETPDHGATLATMPTEGAADLFRAVRLRFQEFMRDRRLACAQFFKNHGHAAGASIEHAHSQIIAMPVVSKLLGEELRGSGRYYEKTGGCVFCAIIERETAGGARVVIDTPGFIVIAPYASRFPYETWLIPKRHRPCYENEDDESLAELADVFRQSLRKTNAVLDAPPYNLVLHTSPFHTDCSDYYHWRLEFIPVIGRVAGFEWGAGFHINSVPPEEAAAALRDA